MNAVWNRVSGSCFCVSIFFVKALFYFSISRLSLLICYDCNCVKNQLVTNNFKLCTLSGLYFFPYCMVLDTNFILSFENGKFVSFTFVNLIFKITLWCFEFSYEFLNFGKQGRQNVREACMSSLCHFVQYFHHRPFHLHKYFLSFFQQFLKFVLIFK